MNATEQIEKAYAIALERHAPIRIDDVAHLSEALSLGKRRKQAWDILEALCDEGRLVRVGTGFADSFWRLPMPDEFSEDFPCFPD